jgi:hypothetical protein
MKASSSQNLELVDQLAKTAHYMVDTMHERAVKMEGDLTKQSKETGDYIVAEMENRLSALEGFIANNPMAAAMVAFGLGAFGTRLFKSMETGWSAPASEAKEGKSVSKAAAKEGKSVSKAAAKQGKSVSKAA